MDCETALGLHELGRDAGEPGADARLALDHVDGCHDCRAFLASMEPELDERLERALASGLDGVDGAAVARAVRLRLRRSSPRRRVLLARAAAVLALAAGVALLLWSAIPDREAGPVAGPDAWLDEPIAAAEVPADLREPIERAIARLRAGDPAVADAAFVALGRHLEVALPLLEAQAPGDPRIESLLHRARSRPSLASLVRQARELRSEDRDVVAEVERALAGDAVSAAMVRGMGWPGAAALAERAMGRSVGVRIRARAMLRAMLVGPPGSPWTRVVLDRRADGAPGYGTSAYSFRHATGDAARHRNAVDLVLNGCGLLHVAPHGGVSSTVWEVGDGPLWRVLDVPGGEGAYTDAFEPREGRAYIQRVVADGFDFHVRYRIVTRTADRVVLEWADLGEPWHRDPATGGRSGMLGQCGGAHGPR